MGQSGLIAPVVHDFRERLAWSETQSHEPFWDAVYRKAFPDMVNHMLCSGDTSSQRQGIDRVIHLSSGKNIHIDEKKREKVWTDILLEYISNDRTCAPGWMEKDLTIDYLAYAFMPTKRCYLFPWPILRRAWLHYRGAWMDTYERVPAQNNGYRTYSLAIPIDILQRAVRTAAVIDVSIELKDWTNGASRPR